MGIEPTTSAWKAEVIPLNYTRIMKLWPFQSGRRGRNKHENCTYDTQGIIALTTILRIFQGPIKI